MTASRISQVFIVGLATFVLLLFSVFAYAAYPGTLAVFLLFDLSFVTMLVLTLPAPRSYVYIFLSIMLFLGFWSKLMLHFVLNMSFTEAIGNFSGNADAWDQALLVSSVAALSVLAVRVMHLVWAVRTGLWKSASGVGVPTWYLRWRRWIWIVSLVAILLLNILNLQFAFYQTGVNPRLVLPYHLNVPLAWLINIGFALWFAVLIHWEFQLNEPNLFRTLSLPIFESLASSTFALSRSIYLLHSIPYFFAIASDWDKYRRALPYRAVLILAVSWAICFAIGLSAVSLLRIGIFHFAYEPTMIPSPEKSSIVETPVPEAPGSSIVETPVPEAPGSSIVETPVPEAPGSRAQTPRVEGPILENAILSHVTVMMMQVSNLFLHRWIGLEGVLAVSSYSKLGGDLFFEGLFPPRAGNVAIYQVISKSGYQPSERFTFGSLPGVVGVLYYSGSYLVVAIGITFLTLLMLTTEFGALRLTGNRFFTTILAIGVANVACQVQFPYLTGIFIGQLWVAIGFVWLLSTNLTHHRVGRAARRAACDASTPSLAPRTRAARPGARPSTSR